MKRVIISQKILKEFIEGKMPNNVSHSKPISNRGSNNESQHDKFTFKTKKGNKVEILFSRTHSKIPNTYSVSFQVNGSMEDDPKLFDSDILKNVFTILPKLTEKLNINSLEIESYVSNSDVKYVKNMDYKSLIKDLLKNGNFLLSQQQKLLNSSIDDEKYGAINAISRLSPFLKFLDGDEKSWNIFMHDWILGSKFQSFENDYKEFRKAYLSNHGDGFPVYRNRRQIIYKKLLSKFMTDWDIIEVSNGFNLIRNQNKK